MSAKKHVRQRHNEILYLVLISMAQSCAVQFFPLYLKHLNLAAFDVGLIRACQVWLSVLLLPIWFSLVKRLHSACWKRIFFCIFLFLIINIYFCLTFMPLSNKLQNVTHCHTNKITQSRKGITSSARSKDSYTNHMLSSLHRIPNVSSEVNSTNVRNMDSSEKHTSDSNNHGSKNISHQNYSNMEHIATEIIKSSEGINKTNLNFLSFGDNETTLKPYNLSRTAHNKSHFNYLNAGINNSNVHRTDNLFSIKFHKNSSNHDLSSITELFSEEHSLSSSTESAYNFETNTKDNYNFNYSDFTISNRSLDQQKTLNSKEKVENILKSNTGYNDQKFPISSSKDKTLDTSKQKTENTAFKNSKSRIEYKSERNRANDMLYYPYHHKKVTHPWQSRHSQSLYHNINSDGKDRTKSGYIEKFQLSDKSQETVKTDHYGTLDTNPGMMRSPNTKQSLKNQNTKDVVAQNRAEENSTVESEETGDWQILKTLLQKQRHRRNVVSKKHHRMKNHHRHHHHLHAHHKSNKPEEHRDRKLNSFDQYSQSDNINEKTLEEGRKIKNHGTIRRLMFVDESEEQNDKSSEVKKLHISVALLNLNRRNFINIIIKSKIKDILSLTFGTILLIAVLVEVFSRAIIATSSQILIPDGKIGGSFQQQIIGYQRENSQQIWTLIIWGIFGCPAVALLVFFAECSYQPRVFVLFSTALIGMALLLALFFLQLPNAVWEWKMKDCGEKTDHRSTPFLKRFGNNISIFVAAFAMACNSEFILWYMDTLNGFPYNYQLLYCGYIGIGAVFQAIVKSWLLRKQMSASVRMQDLSNPDIDTTGGEGVRSIGPILLGLHFTAASMLQPAWSLMFLGVLQGCSAAFLVSARISWCWAAGYGLGCLVGGLVVNLQGADQLFWIMSGSLFVWSAMVTLGRGLLKCIGNNDRDRASYSQLMLLGEDSDKEDVMVEEEDDEEEEEEEEEECNGDDWLERALKKDEQQEAQRRRIMSCPT